MEHQFNTKWYASDEDADHWISYLHRNLHHLEGEDSRFSDSAWSYSQEDADLHDKALDALYLDPQVDASNIKVTVVRKSIYLTGLVSSLEEKKRVTSVVGELREAWNVINLLQIQ